MQKQHGWRVLVTGVALAALVGAPHAADAEDVIRIGVIYDYSGPFAGAGSEPGARGTEIAIELINERGGIEGYMIEPIFVDAQSRAEVAINEAERLIDEQNVDLILGLYSSAHCVPLAERLNARQTIMWATICISTAVSRDRGLEYFFRGTVHSDLFGVASVEFLAAISEDELGKPPSDVRVAIIYEDGPYGTGVADGNEGAAREHGFDIVLREGYAADSADLSSLITSLRRAQPDVILHTGYNPDISLFLRQARELGLRWDALIGHGAGYAQVDRLYDTFGEDADYLFNVDPVAGQLLDPDTLAEGLGGLIEEMVARYRERTGAREVPAHVSMGFNQAWVLLDDVLPRAIRDHGGFDPDAIRQAALETDIPVGGTIQGYGVKFYPPGHELAGDNERAFPVIMQYEDQEILIVWPEELRTAEPVIPLPSGHTYAR
jgi:branched-chain amino acid transport system substrate-binding protein